MLSLNNGSVAQPAATTARPGEQDVPFLGLCYATTHTSSRLIGLADQALAIHKSMLAAIASLAQLLAAFDTLRQLHIRILTTPLAVFHSSAFLHSTKK